MRENQKKLVMIQNFKFIIITNKIPFSHLYNFFFKIVFNCLALCYRLVLHKIKCHQPINYLIKRKTSLDLSKLL